MLFYFAKNTLIIILHNQKLIKTTGIRIVYQFEWEIQQQGIN